MTEAVADPYSVVLKRKKLPMGLLKEAAEYTTVANKALLEQEPFENAFGKQSRRKRVKLDQLMVSRTSEATTNKETTEGKAETVARTNEDDSGDNNTNQDSDNIYESLLRTAQQSLTTYDEVNSRPGLVAFGRDSQLPKPDGEGVDWRQEKKDDLFLKGQSKRIWAEFYKVLDCSDVVLHVIDARNVPGTRCTMIEKHIRDNASHKHLVFVLNKIDLVPNWVAKRWMGELSKVRPTIAFHASLTHAFGKGALISLLRQFGTLHQDKKEISVGVVGYPNVGKSSVINTLISKKSCKVAPIPGETKIWQYISLFKRISLIDCPGVVVDTAGDTETDSVLKGVVRAERLESPEDFVDAIMQRVKHEHIAAQYNLPKDGDDTWSSSTELMEMIAKKCGRLLKGGDPCLRSAAIYLINDFQRGRMPHYVAPPELKDDVAEAVVRVDPDIIIEQDLDMIAQDALESKDPLEEDRNLNHEKAGASTIDVDGVSMDAGDKSKSNPASSILIAPGEWED
jgi:nuclear GTP-binding protein